MGKRRNLKVVRPLNDDLVLFSAAMLLEGFRVSSRRISAIVKFLIKLPESHVESIFLILLIIIAICELSFLKLALDLRSTCMERAS
jgi:hypothetical protein